jgi:hypothetical protein
VPESPPASPATRFAWKLWRRPRGTPGGAGELERLLLPRPPAGADMKRPCIECGRPCNGSRCIEHGGDRRAMSTTARGYGHHHQRRRAQLLPLAIGQPCPLCGETMHAHEQLDLDHEVSAMHGGQGNRIVHAKCNRGRPRRGRGQTGSSIRAHDPANHFASCTGSAPGGG